MSRVLDQSLICSLCASGNCNLWRRREEDWRTANLFCRQCLHDQNLLDKLENNKIKFHSDDNFCYPGPFPIVDEFDVYFALWLKLPEFPEWWNYVSNINLARAIQVRKELESQTFRLEIGANGSVHRRNNCYEIYLYRFDKIIAIPAAVHITSWLKNLSKPISDRIFLEIVRKIQIKYVKV